MKQELPEPMHRMRGASKIAATAFAVALLPPFIALALAPMLLMLVPVAIVGIPFMLPAMLAGSLAARAEDQRRTKLLAMRRRLALVR
jgi:hypothetical protein